MSVRKAHNSGKNHLRNVVDYYQRMLRSGLTLVMTALTVGFEEIGHEKAQSVIDSITSSYADAGQPGQNPMIQAQQGPVGPGFAPPPFGMPGMLELRGSPPDVCTDSRRNAAVSWRWPANELPSSVSSPKLVSFLLI